MRGRDSRNGIHAVSKQVRADDHSALPYPELRRSMVALRRPSGFPKAAHDTHQYGARAQTGDKQGEVGADLASAGSELRRKKA